MRKLLFIGLLFFAQTMLGQKVKVASSKIFTSSTYQKIEKSESLKSKSIKELKSSTNESYNDAVELRYKKNKARYNVPRNGTSYIILSSTKTTLDDCYRCPNRDYTDWCPAKYEVQSRQYTEWKDGEIERVWNTTSNVFMGCGVWRYY